MRRHHAPSYLRRTKEALVSFPDAKTGQVRKLFTKRDVRTASFELDGDEYDFYDALTRYVEDQSIKASEDDSARGVLSSTCLAPWPSLSAPSFATEQRQDLPQPALEGGSAAGRDH
jgi:hypothetical protein